MHSVIVGEQCPFPIPPYKEGATILFRGKNVPPLLLILIDNPDDEEVSAFTAGESTIAVAATSVGGLLLFGFHYQSVKSSRGITYDIPLHLGIEPEDRWESHESLQEYAKNDELRMVFEIVTVNSHDKKVVSIRLSTMPPNVSRFVAATLIKQTTPPLVSREEYARKVDTAYKLFRDTKAIFQTAPAKGLMGD